MTSFVGVTGLMRRMALDRCLPQFLLRVNRWRQTNHWILLLFFALCVSILLITAGEIESLAGVYTLAFLSVMALFALGNMLLKTRRARLPRESRANWPTVTAALLAVLIGLVGNVLLDPLTLEIFEGYFFVAVAVVAIMFLRVQNLRLVLVILEWILQFFGATGSRLRARLFGMIEKINQTAMVYFSKGDNIVTLNQAALYVLDNEQTSVLKVIHVYEEDSEIPSTLAGHLQMIDHLYPQLRIDFLAIQGRFGPPIVESISNWLDIPKNCMFIGTPGDRFPHRIEDLGGVRVIL